jgi:hypothetical protein
MAGTTPGTSRGAGGSEEGKTALGPIGVRDEMEELQKLWYAFSLAPRREHVVCKMEFIDFPPFVLPRKTLTVRHVR